MPEQNSNESSKLSTGLQTIDQFIKISKEIAKLPSLVMADYKGCASDLRKICEKILDGNENVVRWFNKFLYFDFTASDAVQQFKELKGEYEALKAGSRYQELKFDCAEIESIYDRRISSKLEKLFQQEKHQKKLAEAKKVFDELTKADAELVTFIFVEVFGKLSDFANQADIYIDNDKQDLRKAEELRLDFKVKTKELVTRLQDFSNELAELVLEFSKKARMQ